MASILVVEPDEQIGNLLSIVLGEGGHVVKTARSPVEAVELCHQIESLDVVLSAVGLPGMDGHALAGVIAAICPSTRMILMSILNERCAQCPYAGGCDFIPKPFQLSMLADSIAAAVAHPVQLRSKA